MNLPKRSGNGFWYKDSQKAKRANKFIGRGCKGSSTAFYAENLPQEVVNCGKYCEIDTVFISVNGYRRDALEPDYKEISLAAEKGVTFITDVAYDRNRGYNTGERNVANFLNSIGYKEQEPGIWGPAIPTP